MVFDIEIEYFHRRKVCLVAGNHVAHTPDVIAYSNVVKAADVLNAYVMVPNREFWDDACKSARVLYGLKSAVALFRAHLA